MLQVLPAKSEIKFKYTGIVYYLLSGYVDNNGIFVFPNFEERMLEAFKPENERSFHFVEYCEPVTQVQTNKLRELPEAAEHFVKDNGLPFGYILQAIKITTKNQVYVYSINYHLNHYRSRCRSFLLTQTCNI